MYNYKEHGRHLDSLEKRLEKTQDAIDTLSEVANSIQYGTLSRIPSTEHRLTRNYERLKAEHESTRGKPNFNASSYSPFPSLRDFFNTVASRIKEASLPRLARLETELDDHFSADLTLPLYLRRQRLKAGVTVSHVTSVAENKFTAGNFTSMETLETPAVRAEFIDYYMKAGAPIDLTTVDHIRAQERCRQTTVGGILRNERIFQGIELREMAQIIGTAHNILSRWEMGHNPMPPEIRAAYERALGTKVSKTALRRDAEHFRKRRDDNTYEFLKKLHETRRGDEQGEFHTLGDFLRHARLTLHISMTELAETAKCSPDTIENAELGKNPINSKLLAVYQHVLNVQIPEDLLKQNIERQQRIREEMKQRLLAVSPRARGKTNSAQEQLQA